MPSSINSPIVATELIKIDGWFKVALNIISTI
jgi:hypothetical protein